MKRVVAASALLTAATVVSAQPNQPYNCVRDSELRPVFCTGLRPIVTAEMGIPIGTPFFDSSASALYYWSGSSWAGPNALFPDGTSIAPSGAFASSPGTGFYHLKTGDSLLNGHVQEAGAFALSIPYLGYGLVLEGTKSLTAVTEDPYTQAIQSDVRFSGTLASGRFAGLYGIFTDAVYSASPADGTAYSYLYPLVTTATATTSTNGRMWALNAQVDAATGTSHAWLAAGFFQLIVGDTTEATTRSSVMELIGPTSATDGNDSSKLFKLWAGYYGRSLIDQPRDTDYALELTNGQGLSVSGKTNQLQLSKAAGGAKPACASGTRGSFWYEPGGTDVKDTVEVCAKDGANAYAWRTIY